MLEYFSNKVVDLQTSFIKKKLQYRCFLVNITKRSYKKEAPTQVFSCEYCETFKKTYFVDHLRTAAPVVCRIAALCETKLPKVKHT